MSPIAKRADLFIMKKLAFAVVVVAAVAMIVRAPDRSGAGTCRVAAVAAPPRARMSVPVAPVLEVAGKHFETASLADSRDHARRR